MFMCMVCAQYYKYHGVELLPRCKNAESDFTYIYSKTCFHNYILAVIPLRMLIRSVHCQLSKLHLLLWIV